jgi:hypothetical protein
MGNPDADIQFDRAEPAQAAPAATSAEEQTKVRCAECAAQLSSYFDVNGGVRCEACKEQLVAARTAPHLGGVLRAFALGSLAAAVGAGLYYAIAKITGYEIGLVSIVVGLLVGFAVRKGARERGGWRYQAIAMFLTYAAIASTYLPGLFDALERRAAQEKAVAQTSPPAAGPAAAHAAPPAEETPAEGHSPSFGGFLIGLAQLFALGLALPFLVGFENVMGLVLIAIALYEAWKVNRGQDLSVKGPFQVGAAPAA